MKLKPVYSKVVSDPWESKLNESVAGNFSTEFRQDVESKMCAPLRPPIWAIMSKIMSAVEQRVMK